MKIFVSPHKCGIDKTPVNELELNVTKCEFEFAEEITDDYVKEAYFTLDGGDTYKQIIVNNQCDIPGEVLEKKGSMELGVVAYLVENGAEIKRYNPSPAYFDTWLGSLRDAENAEPITPTDKEQMEQAIQDMETKVDNLDIDAEKVGSTTTITITKKDGTQETTEIEDGIDGIGLDYNWVSTSLGIKREDEQEYQYVNLKGERGEPGAIKMLIVNELPQVGQDDTIYLVPLETPDVQGNNYAEYIYVNGAWELLGKIGVQVDLSNYYTKQETYSQAEVNALIPSLTDYVKNTDYATSSTGGVILTSSSYGTDTHNGALRSVSRTYEQYGSDSSRLFISKGTLENVIVGKDLTTKAYVDGLVGDIGTILDSINGESVGA